MLNAQSQSNCSFRAGDDSPDVRLFDDIVSGPITTVVVVLGVIGNAKSIKLLAHTRINVKMASSLIALAIWDIVLLVSSLGYYSLAASTHLFLRANWPFNRTAVFLHGVFALANTISTWLLIEVTVRRFVAVARPLDWTAKALVGKGTKRSRWKKTKTICAAARMPLILTFAAFIVNFPVSFELEVEDCLDVAAMTISQQIAPSALRLHPLYKVYYRAILSAALKTLGPFVLISGLTVAMVVGMRRSFARRKDILDEQHQSSLCESDEDKKQTLQWISTILLCKFMVFRCWPIILDVWEAATLPSQ
uniref:G-protein coupled receptors family 1 profile domain-containing protein n=1 Tax=Plectus sambesii TaxID=2011161 RepID=A0A914UYZ7_9BILA